MAKKKPNETVSDDSDEGGTERGPRRPREYRFEIKSEDGVVTPLNLTLNHGASAKTVLDFLKVYLPEVGVEGTPRYNMLVVHQ